MKGRYHSGSLLCSNSRAASAPSIQSKRGFVVMVVIVYRRRVKGTSGLLEALSNSCRYAKRRLVASGLGLGAPR